MTSFAGAQRHLLDASRAGAGLVALATAHVLRRSNTAAKEICQRARLEILQQ